MKEIVEQLLENNTEKQILEAFIDQLDCADVPFLLKWCDEDRLDQIRCNLTPKTS